MKMGHKKVKLRKSQCKNTVAQMLEKNPYLARFYITGNVETFLGEWQNNIRDIAEKLSINGSFSYSTRNLGRELILKIEVKNSLRGTLTTYGSVSDATVELYREGEESPAYITTVSDTTGKTTYSFSEVEAGNYTLKASKHCTREYSVTVGNTEVTQDAEIRLYGDVLLDGKVNNNDAIQIKRYVNQKTGVLSDLKGEELNYVLKVADVYSADGKVNNNDAIQIQRYVNLKPSIFDSIA